jgi:hypothetical protein
MKYSAKQKGMSSTPAKSMWREVGDRLGASMWRKVAIWVDAWASEPWNSNSKFDMARTHAAFTASDYHACTCWGVLSVCEAMLFFFKSASDEQKERESVRWRKRERERERERERQALHAFVRSISQTEMQYFFVTGPLLPTCTSYA